MATRSIPARTDADTGEASSNGGRTPAVEGTQSGTSSPASAQTANVSGAPFPPYQLSPAARASRNADRVPKVPVAAPPGAAPEGPAPPGGAASRPTRPVTGSIDAGCPDGSNQPVRQG